MSQYTPMSPEMLASAIARNLGVTDPERLTAEALVAEVALIRDYVEREVARRVPKTVFAVGAGGSAGGSAPSTGVIRGGTGYAGGSGGGPLKDGTP